MRSTVITVNLRQPDLMLDDDDDRRRGRDRRDGICLYATDMQHSTGKRAAALVRSCRRRPSPTAGMAASNESQIGSWGPLWPHVGRGVFPIPLKRVGAFCWR